MEIKKKEISLKTKLEDIIILSESLITLSKEIYKLYNEIKLEEVEKWISDKTQ